MESFSQYGENLLGTDYVRKRYKIIGKRQLSLRTLNAGKTIGCARFANVLLSNMVWCTKAQLVASRNRVRRTILFGQPTIKAAVCTREATLVLRKAVQCTGRGVDSPRKTACCTKPTVQQAVFLGTCGSGPVRPADYIGLAVTGSCCSGTSDGFYRRPRRGTGTLAGILRHPN